MTRIPLPGVLLIFFAIASPAAAAQQSADETTRSYDIRELVIAVPDFEAPLQREQPEGTSQPAASLEAPSRAEVVAQLLSALRLALGQERVQMREEEGSLIVTGSAAAHECIASLILEMKRQQAGQINVECRFLVLSREALGKLSPEMRASVALAARTPWALAKEELNQLHEPIRQKDAAQSLTAPNITLFNQQKAYVTVASQQFYVADVERVEGGGWQPKVGAAENGLKVTVRAAASPDGAQASAEVTWWHQRILDIETVEVAPDAQKQLAHLETRQGTRLINGPAGTTFLVGVSEISPPQDAPAGSPAELLLVLVRLDPSVDERKPALQRPPQPAEGGL